MITATAIGRLTGEPEISYTPNGAQVAKFSVASNRGQDKADYLNCRVFGKTAEFVCQYFHKGSWIAVSGDLESFKGNQGDGATLWSLDVRSAGFAGDGQQHAQGQQQPQQQAQTPPQAQPYQQPQASAPGPAKRVDARGNEWEYRNGAEVQVVWVNEQGVRHVPVNGQWVPQQAAPAPAYAPPPAQPPAYNPPPMTNVRDPFAGQGTLPPGYQNM